MLLEDRPSKANKIVTMFSILMNLAVDLDWIATNPAFRAGKIELPPRSQVWAVEDEERFMRGARWELRLALMLLLYTVQRPADVLDMTLGQVSERGGRLWISLRQYKTDVLLAVPVHYRLEPLLRERMARTVLLTKGRKKEREKEAPTISTLLVPSPKGHAWRYRNLARSWDAQQQLAYLRLARELLATGIKNDQVRAELAARHRQRRDIRRTGVVRLGEAGVTTPQIAALSRHKIDRAQKILDTYLPRRSEVALAGIEAWERRDGQQGTIVRIPSRSRRGWARGLCKRFANWSAVVPPRTAPQVPVPPWENRRTR